MCRVFGEKASRLPRSTVRCQHRNITKLPARRPTADWLRPGHPPWQGPSSGTPWYNMAHLVPLSSALMPVVERESSHDREDCNFDAKRKTVCWGGCERSRRVSLTRSGMKLNASMASISRKPSGCGQRSLPTPVSKAAAAPPVCLER